MTNCDWNTKLRNTLIEGFEKIIGVCRNEIGYKKTLLSELKWLRQNNAISSVDCEGGFKPKKIFENKKVGKKFMMLFDSFDISVDKNEVNDLIVLLTGYRWLVDVCICAENWKEKKLFVEARNVLVSTFRNVSPKIEYGLIVTVGIDVKSAVNFDFLKKGTDFMKYYVKIIRWWFEVCDIYSEIVERGMHKRTKVIAMG